MYHLDKDKFGAFIAMLRKEKGFTQKELAERLFVSDKAVSKWETAISVPNIDLLVPLANALGITVTELLMCRQMEQNNVLSSAQVDQVVKTAISYTEEEKQRAGHSKKRWGLVYILSLLAACFEMVFAYRNGCITNGLILAMSLGAGFGIYFCFLAKEKLPAHYDESRICAYSDGAFQMSLPGLALNNSNWGKILTAGRVWAVTIMLGYPVVSYVETIFFTGIWLAIADLSLALFLTLGGLFIPIYAVGKKYE